nr:uncharacterized protein K02A2.6-like [Nicotiana tomentosiformis]
MPVGKLAKWQILLSEFDIVYVTHKAVKGQTLVENLVDGEYELLKTYFPEEEVSFIREEIVNIWGMFFDRAANCKGVGIGAILVSKNGNIIRRTPDLGFLRCVNVKEASRLLEEIHVGMCGPYMNGLILAKKILRAGYFWMTMETNNIKYVQIFHQCQVHADKRWVPPNELNVKSSPWPFTTRGMDVIGPIELAASNGHRFILVAIDYFIKWAKVASYKAIAKKVIADFVRDHIVCRFGVPKSIITDNATNLNRDMMQAMFITFKIKHRNFTTYRPQMNGAVEAANKNIKKILRKMVYNYKQWHEKLSSALLGYRTKVQTSTRETPYLLVYYTEVVIPAEVEIPSLRIIQEAELSDAEWVHSRYDQLALIDRNRMNVVCHNQLY